MSLEGTKMDNKAVDLDVITGLLAGTKIETVDSGVSFAGKSLKLDKEEDASEVVNAMLDCKNLSYLNLEGNTLGVDAAKGIGKALESHAEFKRALWKDMFTGRMKEEIPEALRFLGSGLMLSGATLFELDLSDNAFGPIGVEGLASLLKSKCCFALEILRLNNNGLGITGGKLLASALMSCYKSSKDLGKPLALKVFIAGRNRLENDGAKALSEVFSMLKSLEEIRMPQNGIYHVGITALADAFSVNRNLKILDLNDNTVSEKGSVALAKVLPNIQLLTHLNLGDCLLKTAGALAIGKALSEGHANLQDVNFSCNEIRLRGGLALAEALVSKKELRIVVLDGNQFGDDGVSEVHERLSSCKTATISIEDDEGDEDDDEIDDEELEEEEEEEEEEDEDDNSESEKNQKNKSITEIVNVQKNNVCGIKAFSPSNSTQVTASEFLKTPTVNNFLSLGSNRNSQIMDEVKKAPESDYLEAMLSAIMKVSTLVGSGSQVDKIALSCSEYLYHDLCIWSKTKNDFSLVSNTLLVHLGLMKSEDKTFKVTYNTHGCKAALQNAMTQNYFPSQIKDTMQFFLNKK